MAISSFLPAKRLLLSYVADWLAMIVMVGIGAAFAEAEPNKRPFSLVDLSISYPYIVNEKIPTWMLVVVSLVVPAAVIFLVCAVFVPGRTISARTSRSLILRRKFWECNTGWMGLALSLSLAFLITQGMKNVFGKPRPDLLARCQPDLDAVTANAIENYASSFDPKWVLVGASICQQENDKILNDAWRSFPSGHASTSWSGLFYLALFLCSKFAISIPFLPPGKLKYDSSTGLDAYKGAQETSLPMHQHDGISEQSTKSHLSVPPRNQAAAPPTYLLALPLVPIGAAMYITATRFYEFYHHGFDVLSGSILGIATAWFAFRWYHLPVGQGAGWAWGARSRDRAWAIGVGTPGYVGTEGWGSKKQTAASQNDILGPGDGSGSNREEPTEV